MQTCGRLRTSIKPHPTQESATYIHFFQPLSFAPLHYLRDFHCRQNYNRASITSLDHLHDEFPEDSYWCLCSQARGYFAHLKCPTDLYSFKTNVRTLASIQEPTHTT